MAIPNATQWRGGQGLSMVDMNGSAASAGFSYGIDYLAGREGVTEREGSLVILSGTAGDRFLHFPIGTTLQRSSTRSVGAVRFNTTTSLYEFWTGVEWIHLLDSRDVHGAVRNLLATRTSSITTMTWNQPFTADQGFAVGGYQYRLDGGAWTTAGNGTQDLALAFGSTYNIEVVTLNSANVRGVPTSLTYTLSAPTYTPANAVYRGSLPYDLLNPSGITWDGGQLVIVDVLSREIWTLADATTPSGAVNRGNLPSGLRNPSGITWDGGQLVIVDSHDEEIWTLADVTTPSGAVNRGNLPSGLGNPAGITWDGGQLVIVDFFGSEIWTLADATTPSGAVNLGNLPSGLGGTVGITWDGGQLVIVDNHDDEIWTLADATTPSGAVNRGNLPSGLRNPNGITWDGGQLVIAGIAPTRMWTLSPD